MLFEKKTYVNIIFLFIKNMEYDIVSLTYWVVLMLSVKHASEVHRYVCQHVSFQDRKDGNALNNQHR